MKYALLVIDMNAGMFDLASWGGILYRAKEYLIPCINELAAAFRARNLPVIWITQRWKDDMSDAQLLQRKKGDRRFVKSSDGWRLLPQLDVLLIDDRLIFKTNYSAFFGTDLHNQLQTMGVTSLVIAGVNTHACIRVSTLDAYQRGYDPLIWARNCIAASLPQFEKDTLDYMVAKPDQPGLVEGLLTNKEIIARLDA